MSAAVRTFFHNGLATAPVTGGTRYTTDSVSLLRQPYLSRSAVTASATAASTAAAPVNTKIAFVQVEEGKTVHYEINPPNRTTEADTSSPTLSGSTQFEFGVGWTISFLEATIA